MHNYKGFILFKIFIDASKIEVLPDGDFDKYYPLICHNIQLLRLGSERTDFEASHLLSGIDSAGGYCRKSKFAGNKVVIEAEVYYQNVDHKHKSYSNLESTSKKPEEIELNAKMTNQDDNDDIVINESKVCVIMLCNCILYVCACYVCSCYHSLLWVP